MNVDLQTDATLQVDISDALSERDKVKFTVHTKVRLFTWMSSNSRNRYRWKLSVTILRLHRWCLTETLSLQLWWLNLILEAK